MGAWSVALVRASYVAALLLFVAGSAMTVEGELWVSQLGGLSSVGLASISALYALSEHRFRSLGVPPLRSFVMAVLFANAFLQSYEIVYGFSFLPPLTGAQLRTTILWFLMVAPLVLMRDYLRFKWTSGAVLALFVAVWAVWLLYGFPQYYYQGYAYPRVLMTDDPFRLSLWLNFGSKAVLAAFFAALLEPVKSARDLVSWTAGVGRGRTGNS